MVLIERARSGSALRLLKYLAVGALAFQVVHFIEHIAQLGYWLMHPVEAPWLTPWAAVGRDMLAVGGSAAIGNELLHLIGNAIFISGLVAMAVICHRHGRRRSDFPHLGKALWAQGLHVIEHVALTSTTLVFGKAIGVSTFLGLVSGPVMTSYRVWFHFILNGIATYYALRALTEMHQEDLVVSTAPQPSTA